MMQTKRMTDESIALLPIKDRYKEHKKIESNPNTHIKRLNRIKALKKATPFNLDEKKMKTRVELAQKSIDARETNNALTATTQQNNVIYCCKTGAYIGKVDYSALAFLNALDLPFSESKNKVLTLWHHQHAVHPAWLNTSPNVLSQLQRIMPHEYCVYVYTYLIERHADTLKIIIKTMQDIEIKGQQKWTEVSDITIKSMPANYKNLILNELYKAPLETIIELAELLRILAALMGKNKVIVAAMPKMALQEFNFSCIYKNELLQFIRKALKKEQERFHSDDVERARFITKVDVYNLTTDGIKLFHEARINLDDDNPILADIADLFRKAGLESTMIVRNYSEIAHIIDGKQSRKKEYSTKLIESTANKNKQKDKEIKPEKTITL